MIEYLIVGVIVGSALLYSGWALMPATLRRAAAGRLAAGARRAGLGEPGARRLQTKLETAATCSECAHCKGCATGKKQVPASRS